MAGMVKGLDFDIFDVRMGGLFSRMKACEIN